MTEMRDLPSQEIKKLLREFPQARRIAVENFLSTVSQCDSKYFAYANLDRDRILYGWNSDTYRAIRKGIEIAAKKLKTDRMVNLEELKEWKKKHGRR